ncbi:Hypothetical Protein FCC1311_024352 [Hondaea fermentalgiana]|uniref:Uncharacterized protein n=1 Tax=Hondaea fermentalgiana TaxID=2315210 RepID=A0A2R5GEH7_9STRA|nr:Hypothetical Protein FCC1311_024352 [Hondaea fermentalgiana]|eukprot:GBG26214.1 Hypothetical Protein FCC1311_024352 [Hondaea fermentalgiana]
MSKIFHRDEHHEFAFEEEGASSDEEDLETVEARSAPSEASKSNFLLNRVKGGVQGAGISTGHKLADKKIGQRIWLALIAVCWLWITSYGMAKAIVEAYIPIPALTDVSDRNSFAYSTSTQARDDYADDVNRVADACEADFDRTFRLEVRRRDLAKLFNQNELTWLIGNITIAETKYNATQTELYSTVDMNDANVRTTSNATECLLIDGIVAGDAAAINSLNAANAYRATSELAAEDLAFQIQRKKEYDEEYFANKTDDLQSLQLMLVASVHNTSNTFDNTEGFAESLRACMVVGGGCSSGQSIFTKIQGTFTEAEQFFTRLTNALADYETKALEQMTEYRKTIQKINELKDDNLAVLEDAFGSFGTIPPESDADTDTIYYVSFSDTSITDVISTFPDLYSGLTSNISADGTVFEDSSEALRSSSTGWEAGWTDDYDPPEVDTNETLANLSASGDSFFTNFSSTLSGLTPDSTDDAEPMPSDSVNAETLNTSLSSSEVLVRLTDHSSWDFYAYDDSITQAVSDGIQEMSDLILIFDIIFRIIRTFLIVHKYWSLTGLATPPGDARIKMDNGAGWGPKKTPLQKIAAIVLNPIVITILSVVAVGVIFGSFWYAYSPLYYEYVDSCVQNDWRDIEAGMANGTMLYRNGYTATFQYACADGDSLAQSRTDDINVGRDVECSKQSFDDTVLYNAQVERFNEAYERFFSTVSQNAALVECLDLAYIDGLYSTDFESSTDDPVFDLTFGPLTKAAIYECDNVEGCEAIRGKDTVQSQAEGPDENLLRSVTFDAACSSEYWVHANLFAGISVVGIFIIINISRIIGSRALVRVLWRIVVVRNFSVLISVTDRGDIVYPERVTEKGDTMQEAIRLAVRKAIKRWERWGWVLLVTSLVMNVPWIWALHWVSSTIEYTSEAD